jgi:hypothetical protein
MKTNYIVMGITFMVILSGCSSLKSVFGHSSTMDILQKKYWQAIDDSTMSPLPMVGVFENNKLISIITYASANKKYRSESYFYLSDHIEPFDSTKIGKAKNGRYIIELSGTEKTTVLEIKKISDKLLVLSNAPKPEVGLFKYRSKQK